MVLLKLLGTRDGRRRGRRCGSGTRTPTPGSATSVVASGYGAGREVRRRLGVLGPTRMDYPTTIAAVRAVARYVSRILAHDSRARPSTTSARGPALSDHYETSACPATPPRTTSRRPTAGWPASCTPTSTPARRPRSGSRRSRRPTRCSPTPRSAQVLRPRRRPTPAAPAGFGAGFGFSDIFDAFFGAAAAAQRGPRSRQRAGPGRADPARHRPRRGHLRRPARPHVDTAVVCPTCDGAARSRAPRRRPATSAAAAARSSRCSARSSARS